MPSYQVIYVAEELETTKNYVAYNASSAMDSAIQSEKDGDWGLLLYVDVKKVMD